MNKNILYAGGFKNLNSTSYVNSTLQVFLHFKPFIEQINFQNPSKSNENYSLILSLQNIIKKLKTTDGSLSADSVVSAMNIDPKISQTINSFFMFFRYLINFDMLKFDFEECKTSINDEINLSIQNSKDFNSDDLNANFIYVHLKPNNHKTLEVDRDIFILDCSFTLYAVVQVILSPAMHNHYFVTLRDKSGWMLYNDTAVTKIDDEQIINLLKNLITPVEILIYIRDINDSVIIRKPAVLRSTFTLPKETSNHLDQVCNIINREENHEDIEQIIRRTENSDDDCREITYDEHNIYRHIPSILSPMSDPFKIKTNQFSDNFRNSIYQNSNNFIDVPNESDDDQIKEIKPLIKTIQPRNKSRLIDSDPARYRRIIEQNKSTDEYDEEEEDVDDVHVKFFDSSIMKFTRKINDFNIPKIVPVNKLDSLKDEIEDYTSKKVRYTLIEKEHEFSHTEGKLFDIYYDHPKEDEVQKTAIFELENMNSFDINEFKKCKKCQILFSVYDDPDIQFNGEFVIDQTFNDILDYINIFMNEIYDSKYNYNYKVYLEYEEHYFKVSKEKEIKEIQQLIRKDKLHFVIGDKKKNELFSIRIPIFLNKNPSNKYETMEFMCNIDDTCQMLINSIDQNMILRNPVITQYIEEIHKFKNINMIEKIFHLIDYKNLQIQTHQRDAYCVVFIYEDNPFLFEIRPNISKNILEKEIASYLSLEVPFSLHFMNDDDEKIYIESDFLEAYKKKKFAYVLIN